MHPGPIRTFYLRRDRVVSLDWYFLYLGQPQQDHMKLFPSPFGLGLPGPALPASGKIGLKLKSCFSLLFGKFEIAAIIRQHGGAEAQAGVEWPERDGLAH